MYLGSPFTANGSVSSSVRAHAAAKMVHKIHILIEENNDIPFRVKKRIFEACVISAFLYGCEYGVDADLRPVIKL